MLYLCCTKLQNYKKMIKETKIGTKIFIEQTTYYVYASEAHRMNDRAAVTTSDKKVFDKIKKKANFDAKRVLTDKEKLYQDVYDKVYGFKTKYPQGFITSEIDELLKDYPDIDMNKYNDAMMGNTCMIAPDNQTIIYHCDIEKALLCGIEKRGLKWYEFD